ncbi:MAG: exodeoxyribonuclease VII small subunit [Christensenellales bacterium]|jgi:exodeoxyribonuclease VII small subunit|nr:exodeoxyribonuclease VII small subunit [Clostridiales bacterium]
MNFETNLKKLENLLNKLENEQTSIDESLKIYEEAIALSKKCIESINKSKGKLEILTQELNKIDFEIN